ncbi:GNAT family N-acetyltransferase [Halobacteriales archaeon QH_3_68_24]|nr:MAG: GNAT family N-acetyltransferase [Halobacteriales archaeon QH_3_68_24]
MADLFPDRIETERLVLEPLTTETVDALDLYEHVRVGAPHVDEVTEYLTWDPHETPKETVEFVEGVTEKREAGEGATYLIRPRGGEQGAGEFAGLAGLSVDWRTQTATLGTWLRKPFWGRGYSGERAAALIEVAFERLDLEAVVVTVHEGNEKSRTAVSRYVEAHGGRREGLLRNYHAGQDDTPVDVYRFTIAQAEYEGAAGE